jgi:hypothetical protein
MKNRVRRKPRRAATVPPNVLTLVRSPIEGDPDPKHISTSYAERANLTMRMHMRRFFTAYYNFVRINEA